MYVISHKKNNLKETIKGKLIYRLSNNTLLQIKLNYNFYAPYTIFYLFKTHYTLSKWRPQENSTKYKMSFLAIL